MKVKNELAAFVYALGVCAVETTDSAHPVRHAYLREINPEFEAYEVCRIANSSYRALYRINEHGPDQKIINIDMDAFNDVPHVASLLMAAYEMHVAENKKKKEP